MLDLTNTKLVKKLLPLYKIYIMKVKIRFYCVQEKKTYLPGDEYTGNRTDITDVLEKTIPKPVTKPIKKPIKKPVQKKATKTKKK